jgi:ribosomal protein L22
MSAEDEKDLGGETPQEPTGEAGKAARKPVRAPKAAKARAGEPAAAAAGEQAEAAAGEGKPARAAAKKPAPAKKPAVAKKPAARRKAPAAKAPAAEPAAKDKAEPTAAPRRAAAAAKPAPRRKVVRARARYVRTSARKARMVCGHLRGKSVQEARAILAFTPREVARDWSKLLESAVANAESNHELLEDDLIVREAYADEGPTIKRFRPRAMGRATPIRKRTSHLTITLTPGPERPTTKRHG